MKSILFITAFPPNQMTAGQDYSRRLILDLVGRGYDVSLLYASYPGHNVELPAAVRVAGKIVPSWRNCVRMPPFHPFFTRKFNRRFLSRIQAMARDFDIVYFDFSQVHLYSLFLEHPCKILMCHDVICQKYTRKGKLQLPWIKYSEKKILETATKIITFSRKDSMVIKKIYDLDSYPVHFYLKNEQFDYSMLADKIEEDSFCFYGAWNRLENSESLEWFLDNVYPSISKKIKFRIIGGGLSEKLKSKMTKCNNIKILGFVDEPILELARNQALIAPLYKGAGVKVKVVDALSAGTPVLGTYIAFEGIEDNKNFRLFNLCSKKEEFIDSINNWKKIDVIFKQDAMNEFFERYNKNRFIDILKSMNLDNI